MHYEEMLLEAVKPLLYFTIPALFISDLIITRVIRKKYENCDIWMYKLNHEFGFKGMLMVKTFFASVCLFFLTPPPYGVSRLGGLVAYIGCTTCFIIDFFRYINKRKKEMNEDTLSDAEHFE